jgi:hypothetical protein
MRTYQQSTQMIIQDTIDTRNRTRRSSRVSRLSSASNDRNDTTPNLRRYITQPLNYVTYISNRETGEPVQQLQDVIVSPSQREIALATRVFRYSTEYNCNTRCPISLEDFQDNDTVTQIKYCNHTFKETAINRWFLTNVRCPICRYDIRDYSRSETDLSNNDISGIINDVQNNVQPSSVPTPLHENTDTSRTINALLRTLALGLGSAIDNYMEESELGFSFDLSNSAIFEFELQGL